MRGHMRQLGVGYLIAVIATAMVAVLRKYIFGDILGADAPLTPFLFAVMAAAWYGGFRPGLLATALGLWAGTYFFIERNGWQISDVDRVRMGMFVAAGVGISWFAEAMHRNRNRADQQRESLRVTLSSIGDAVISTDVAGRVIALNPVAENLTGWTSAEAVGQPLDTVLRIVHEKTRQTVADPAAQALKAESIVKLPQHTILIAKDGTERPIDDSAAPMRDAAGQILGVVLTFRDVSEQRQAQQLQLESEQRFRTLFESMDEGFCIIEMIYDADNRPVDYRFLEVNPPFEKHTGFVDAAGKTIRELVPDHDAHWFEIYGKVAATGVPSRFINEAKAMGRWYDVYAYRVGGPGSHKVGVLFTDITERKRVDDNLQQMAADLSAADRRKDEFLATLAHELRNPLAPIRTALQIVRLAGNDKAAVEQALSVMERQLQQMVRLIDDLMDVSRITRNKLKLRKERIELATVVRTAVETSHPLIESAGHELTAELPTDPIHVDGDPTRLAQVFSNLLNNAAKYTERGGRIRLTVEREGSDAVVRVKDTGVGIPAEHLPHIFEIFSQVDRSLERSQGGLGIGLSLVKGLTEMHGGTIEAHSEGQGKGSEFIVRLPVVSVRPAKHQPVDGECGSKTAVRCKVLVVDDNKDAATSLSMMLRIMGHDSAVASDGLHALEVAESYRPDIMLLDIGLPKLNGYGVARRAREQSWGKQMTLIALTGWGHEEDKRQAKEAGFDHHLVKPVEPAQLEKLLAKLCPTS